MSASDSANFSIEPTLLRQLTFAQKEQLAEILDRYLSAMERGAPPSRTELLAQHSDLVVPLAAYLDSLDELHGAAAVFGRGSESSNTESASTVGDVEKRLGDFRLIREIGRGGMGVVYEAWQISLDRRVALKVLPFASVLDSRQIARFKHEAQAAAHLEHPNIVSVFAVGVERGVHYYAMQFIDGQPLDQALAGLQKSTILDCPATKLQSTVIGGEIAAPPKNFTTARRRDSTAEKAEFESFSAPEASATSAHPTKGDSLLTTKSTDDREYFRTIARLGIQAAEALHAAHEQGIVHRDIKPSNLLLDADAKLWVTDFGLARCRTETSLTVTGDIVGTVRYMSPEQASGQAALLDHRTDIYSLGVTLYELIALKPAFPDDNGAALMRRIEQEEPPPLRQIRPKVPMDLEMVVFKAMSKRREDRYTTAREFADDLRCVLEGRPTVARPATIAERLVKWTRRHHRLVSVAVAVCFCAVLGMGASMFIIAQEKNKAEQNYVRAEKYFHEAKDAVDCLGARVAQQLADVSGAEQVRLNLLQDSLRYYRNFIDQARDQPALRADLALTYSKLGNLIAEIGSNDDALEAQQNAISLYRQLVSDNPREPDYRRNLALSENHLALLLGRSGRTEAARRSYHDAIRLQDELVRSFSDAAEYLNDLATSHNNLGLLQKETNEAKEAEASFGEAIRLQQHLLDIEPNDPERMHNLAVSFNSLGGLYAAEKPDRAAEFYQKVLSYQKKALDLRPNERKYQHDIGLTYNNLGALQSRQGLLAEAEASFASAVKICEELVHRSPASNSARGDLAVSLNNLGLTQNKLEQFSDAKDSFRRALILQESLVRQNPHDLDLHSNLGGMYNNLGMVLEKLRQFEEAEKSYRQAIDQQRIAESHAPGVLHYREFLSNHYYNYGRVLRRQGKPDEAARISMTRRELWPNDPKHLFAVAEELAWATKQLANSKCDGMTAKQCAELALETLRQAVAAGWKPDPASDWSSTFDVLKDYPGYADVVKK